LQGVIFQRGTFSGIFCNLVLSGQFGKDFEAEHDVGHHVGYSLLQWDKKENGLLNLFCAFVGTWGF